MKKIYKNAAEKQAAYLQRKREKQELAAEQADEIAAMRRLNLCGYGEVAYETPAQTWLDEVQIHRSWLRALEQPDVLPGETLRDLARRTFQALLASKNLGVITDGGGKWIDGKWIDGFDVWYPLFSPSQQDFQIPFDSARYPQGPFGEGIRDAAKEGWFDLHWKSPEGTGDEPIDIENLPSLPPIKPNQQELKQAKPVRPPAPLVEQPQDFVSGYETPLEEQNKLYGFGSFGMTRTVSDT